MIGSVVGTCLGILGTTINNRMRMKELRQIVRDASVASSGTALTTTPGSDDSFERIKSVFEKQQQDLISVTEKVIIKLIKAQVNPLLLYIPVLINL